MVDAGYFTEGQVAAARRKPATPIDHTTKIDSPNYFLDWVFDRTKDIVAGRDDVGFIVRTTIDPTLQSYAEEAVTLDHPRKRRALRLSARRQWWFPNPNGAVRAMVGGTDYGQSQYNRAVVSARQPGSSFKPFVYATAFEELGITPESTIVDRPVCIGNWCPAELRSLLCRHRLDPVRLLSRSINTVPVTLSIKTGREPIAEMAHRPRHFQRFPGPRVPCRSVLSRSACST